MSTTKPPLLTSRLYDILKPMTSIVLPGVATFYFALAQIWGLPNAEKVVGTIAALTTLLGVLLGASSKSYNNSEARYGGTIDVAHTAEGKKIFSLKLNTDPDDLEQMGQVLFRIEKE
jgi:imidazoleglycerol phosphate synthase glutamine amidotransferase subunit HisH